ncbi:MAG: glycosyl transferase family 36 [Anaerolineae bacterium]|nr:glycosyl transferase family 36 [Anaerolineae bacterium]
MPTEYEQLATKYGHFSADGKAFVVTRADTPMPWVNVISNGDYGFVVSQAGSGYSWRTHASMNRITRWSQDLIRDDWGKYLYLRDAASGAYWSPTYQPCGSALEGYTVTHGMGYTRFEGAHDGIPSRLTQFVPLDAPCEVWMLRLRNTTDRPRRLQIFSYFEWLLGSAPDWHREFHRVFIQTQMDAERQVMLAHKVLWELPGTHWNHAWEYVAFHGCSEPVAGFDGDKRAFVGRHGSLCAPAALATGQSQQTQGRYGDAIGSLQTQVELAPGEARDIVFVLGAAGDEAQAYELSARYCNVEAAQSALDAVRSHWEALTGRLRVASPDPAIDVLANGWLSYQAIACRLWGRTAYYQTGGAYGFRDQLQDSLVWLLLDLPERTLDQIRLHASHQYQAGIVLHWWHPIAETGLQSNYSDDLLWLPCVTAAYIHETGDAACLDEIIPFHDGGTATLREHCLRAVRVALTRRSERGLPLILSGDWNDGMNAVGGQGRGESVWMAHFLSYVIDEFGALDDATGAEFRAAGAELRAALDAHAWDGAWFTRATTDAGKVLGTCRADEGKIFLNAQTWAVIGKTAGGARLRQAMDSARQYLYQDYGALLFWPAYSTSDSEIGYLTRYAPGIRENGGVYVHAACWAVWAERELNGVDAAYDLWRRFCPPVRSASDADAYAAEPYVMPGNVSGPQSPTPGQAGWTWYTGSAQWYLRVLVESVLGIRARRAGLEVRPALPAGWQGYRVHRRFRRAEYIIHVERDSTLAAPRILIDGEPWEGDILPVAPPGASPSVEIAVP